ncbi:D-glycero-D-manno-heptose 1,7-bisphosphate phosphatase [Pedobacter sp. W3I1]|uniref:D-glycero-alpha-D-manno-heptose-1,7-bisphosphate 7-phosphatase n=1 Tax=Pedobacter sp. W3I1 TaxID=3042291 RepID=UPI002784B665|nr:HAD family hydrolase [Pedobacter sp. W3I1]MDQ0637847.1 D-glycero-D-manno-heptose 1,7-bisphosphate phosphatase [Pedobacter sp. W3I1]
MAVKKAVFLDKDGTLIPDIPYNADPDLISLETGVGETLAQLAEYFQLIVITNQAGIAFGRFTEKDLIGVEKRIADLLQHYGVRLSGFYYCPHHPQGSSAPYAKSCTCRKPGPGLIIKAAGEHSLSLSDSWMIGDILNDVQAGKAAGCKSILIDNGNETEWDFMASPERIPDYISKDFADAGKYILRTEKNEKYSK